MPNYNILSIDGGGVLGVVAARVLQRIEEQCPEVISRIDLFAGTSTGGLVSLALANGFTPAQVVELYRARSKEIFHRSFWRWINFNLFIAKYSNNGLQSVVNDIFGKKRLKDLDRKVLISTFILDENDWGHRTYMPTFFTNLVGKESKELVSNIAMYTCSAPTYFPTYGGYIDGALSCNNPSVAAIAQSLNPLTEPVPALSEINLLSLGTGKVDQYIAGKTHNWGIVNWAPKLVEVMLNSDWAIADYQSKQFLNDRYHRVNPILDENYAIDDASVVDRVIACVDRLDLTPDIKWVKNNLLWK